MRKKKSSKNGPRKYCACLSLYARWRLTNFIFIAQQKKMFRLVLYCSVIMTDRIKCVCVTYGENCNSMYLLSLMASIITYSADTYVCMM